MTAPRRTRAILLNPGPVNLSPRVRAALGRPDLCHREAEFAELQQEVRDRILAVYGLDPARWAAVLLGGSGTAAVEAMVTSLTPHGERRPLVVLENGVYGERLSRIAQIHGIPVAALHHHWGAAIPLETVVAALDASPPPRHVAMVHHETTTGRLNRVAAAGNECRDRGIGLLLDGVSSFGAEEIDFDGWGVTACAATANKCLHGAPGVSFVVVRRDALAPPDATPRTLYLDLGAWCRAQDQRTTPFTPPVTILRALLEALREHEEAGGVAARREQYTRYSAIVARGLAELGVEPILAREDSSVVLRAYHLPVGLTYERLHDGLKARGYVIYAGQGNLARTLFRVSTMGDLYEEDLRGFVDAFREVLETRR